MAFGRAIATQQEGATVRTGEWAQRDDVRDRLQRLQRTAMSGVARLATGLTAGGRSRWSRGCLWRIRRGRFGRVVRVLVESLFQCRDPLRQLPDLRLQQCVLLLQLPEQGAHSRWGSLPVGRTNAGRDRLVTHGYSIRRVAGSV